MVDAGDSPLIDGDSRRGMHRRQPGVGGSARSWLDEEQRDEEGLRSTRGWTT
ncbi:hypothetical protein AB0L70_01190 [Kribbella sp. NPDC051952]|uniref:hypothetical protein n=1 Tax=Kribbella sp. NPDC051952 TaxID=3154851 RepID=UPI00342A9A6D